MSRVGIELAPTALRVVELDAAMERGRDTRVRSYVVLPRSGPDADAWLRALRGRSAGVVVWGAGPDHRQVVVSRGSYPKMRAEALAAAASAGVTTRGALGDIAAAGAPAKGVGRQPVVLALASASAIAEAVQPLVDAGIRIKSVLTPADALFVLARTRQPAVSPGLIDAYVALDETATCLALIRNGALVGARELPWGYGGVAPSVAAGPPGRRDDLAARLASALQRFVVELGGDANAIGQVTICGGLPELRTMAVPLMERLDVEVETLDSLFKIDPASLPHPEELFREHAAELRLAWAAAAEAKPPIDLLRSRRYRNFRAIAQRAAIAAGVVAALGLGWGISQTRWWQATAPVPKTAARRGVATRPVPVNPLPRTGGAGRPTTTPVASPLLVARARVSPIGVLVRSVPPPAIEREAPPPPQLADVEPSRSAVPAPVRPAPSTPPIRTAPSTPSVRSVPPQATSPSPRRAPARPTRPAAPSEAAPLPFDADLGTILYSADRKLAVIDGRIVGVGDVVKGARITDISTSQVLLRDSQGRLRQLTLGAGNR